MNNGYKRFIEDNLMLVDKEAKVVPFKLNAIQDKFLTQDTTRRKDLILKARQQGFSTLILGAFLADFLLKPNTYNLVVADTADNAKALLSRVKFYMQAWADKTGVSVDDILKYNSKYELYFEGMNSTYHIGTAQNVNFGRSRTITNLHLSEAAFYPHFMEIMAGALQAVVPEGWTVIETTANGFNVFKEYWDDSVAGETAFKPLFYPASHFYDKDFLKSKEQELQSKFPQEYPETATESFITSGESYFDKEALGKYLEDVTEPMTEGVIYV